MVVRMRHTHSATGQRRSHHSLARPTLSRCSHCNMAVRPHTMCQNCGYYQGRQVVDVLAKLDKKARKQKEKELHAHEHAPAKKGETISAEELFYTPAT